MDYLLLEPTSIKTGTLADGADIVVISTGTKQQAGESRLDLVQRNGELFKGDLGNNTWQRISTMTQ